VADLFPINETPGAYIGALSRLDNKTEICSACGTDEAMEDYMDGFVKGLAQMSETILLVTALVVFYLLLNKVKQV